MHRYKKHLRRFLSVMFALLLIFTCVPVNRANAETGLVSEPLSDEMAHSHILNSLEYLGYNIQFFRDNDMLFEIGCLSHCVAQGYYIWPDHTDTKHHITYMNPADIQTDIDYNNRKYGAYGGFNMGLDTIPDPSTKTGKAPDVAKFEEEGWPCLSYLNYYFFNYLPNIVGKDTSDLYELFPASKKNETDLEIEHYLGTVENWRKAMDAFAAKGKAVKYSVFDGTAPNPEEVYQHLSPGDVMIFGYEDGSAHSSTGNIHVAIYAGTRTVVKGHGDDQRLRTEHFFIHMPSGDTGPEITTVNYFSSSGSSKSSKPNTWYHIPGNTFPRFETGTIEVYKTGDDGKALAGATFEATHVESGASYKIGPTNENGYAFVKELPLGTYKVVETVFPEGYRAGDVTEWTVTIDEDTPNYTIAIHAVNNLITGKIRIVKSTNTGENLSGWTFDILRAEDREVVGTYTTGEDGTITTDPLPPGDYIVVETGGAGFESEYWLCDTNEYAVLIEADKTTDHALTNTHCGKIQVIKKTNTNENLGNWSFDILRAADKSKVETITTDHTGVATSSHLEPGEYIVVESGGIGYDSTYWLCDANEYPVIVVVGETTQHTVTNIHYGKLQILKKMETDGPLSGWQFRVTRVSDDKQIGIYTTDDNGRILVDNLLPGEYRIEELLEEDGLYYCMGETVVSVNATEGQTVTVNFVNALRPGRIIIDKENEMGERLANAKFLLEWSEDGNEWHPVTYNGEETVTKGGCSSANLTDGCLITDENGQIAFENLYPTLQYRITELVAPSGYEKLSGYAFTGVLPEGTLELSICVTNCPGYALPATGANGFHSLVVIGSAAMTLFLGVAVVLICATHNLKPATKRKERK